MQIPIHVDRAADKAVYRQIADQLRSWIQSPNGPVPGTRLPSESELVDALGVARMTVRQALNELQTAGLVQAQHGRGVFVIEAPWYDDYGKVLEFGAILVAADVLPDRHEVLYFFEKPWKWDREWQLWHSRGNPEPPIAGNRRPSKTVVTQWQNLIEAFEELDSGGAG